MTHAVHRLREQRAGQSAKPFVARGSRAPRCAHCRVQHSHCLCALRPDIETNAGMCLLMADIEPLKPTNTGWLIADVVADTFAFSWARTQVDKGLIALRADPQWEPMVVFPAEFVDAHRVITEVAVQPGKRPLFILLDGTWAESCKMCRKSPYLDQLPVLSMKAEAVSRYRLRRAKNEGHLCTSQVGAMCLALAGEKRAAETLDAYLDVFTSHYLNAKFALPVNFEDEAHQKLHALAHS